jgi:iron complex transport system substrate-binding protein
MQWRLFLLFSLGFWACNQTGQMHVAKGKNGNSYATLFEFKYQGKDSFLTIFSPGKNRKVIQKFYKGPRTAPKNCIKIDIAKRVVTMDCVLAEFTKLIGEEKRVVGIDNIDFFASKYFQDEVKAGRVTELQKGGEINLELLSGLNASEIWIGGMGEGISLDALERIGIQPIYFLSYMESHPLGSAEWSKVANFLLGGKSNFFEIEKANYEELISHDTKVDSKVLLNAPYEGVWHSPKEQSPIVQLIRDAGGEVIPVLPGTGSSPLMMEQVFEYSNNVDFWLNTGLAKDRKDLLLMDKRMAKFGPWKKASIFNNIKQRSKSGANSYYEIFNTQPSIILAEIKCVFKNCEEPLNYYEKLE